MEYAEIGDEIALLIVRDAAQHIERFIETIFAKGASRCVLMGGLAPRIKPWLRARVVEKLSAPLGDALDGDLILAGLPIGSFAFGRGSGERRVGQAGVRSVGSLWGPDH